MKYELESFVTNNSSNFTDRRRSLLFFYLQLSVFIGQLRSRSLFVLEHCLGLVNLLSQRHSQSTELRHLRLGVRQTARQLGVLRLGPVPLRCHLGGLLLRVRQTGGEFRYLLVHLTVVLLDRLLLNESQSHATPVNSRAERPYAENS
jgi:hypothetical protein